MHGESLDFATRLAVFFRDYGSFAWNAIMLLAVMYLFRLDLRRVRELREADKRTLDVALQVVPLADKLSAMVASATRKRMARGGTSREDPESAAS